MRPVLLTMSPMPVEAEKPGIDTSTLTLKFDRPLTADELRWLFHHYTEPWPVVDPIGTRTEADELVNGHGG